MASEMALEILREADSNPFPNRTMPKILCCMCGLEIESNPANMCVNCLRGRVDITDGIPKQIIIHQCRGCARYLRPPWVACDLESKELLAICLKKVTGLNKVRLVDAGFIWTEPHSRRLKIKLTIQKEVLNGVRLQQVFVIEFLIQNQQCDACQRSYTDHVWRAMVQVRQRVDHKKTFFLLEQLILKHSAHTKCMSVEQKDTGVDFAFSERSHAFKFIDFLNSVVPVKSKSARQLISEDTCSAIMNYKFSYAVEIVPLCKDDLTVLPAKLASQLGNINPLVLVQRVSNHIFFVDPRSLQMAEIDADKYWRDPFRALMSQTRLEEFTILDVLPVTIAPLMGAALRRKQKPRKPGLATVGEKRKRGEGEEDDDAGSTVGASSMHGGSTHAGGYTGAVSLHGGSVMFHGATTIASTVTGGPKGKYMLADVEVMKTRDMGVCDTRYIVRTHMGNILRSGDVVLGYDCSHAVYNDADAESAAIGGATRNRGTAKRAGRFDMPDIVLVRKTYKRKNDVDEADTLAPTSTLPSSAAVSTGEDVEMPAISNAAAKAAKQRTWKLKRFDDDVPTLHSESTRRGEEEKRANDFEAFLREIEDDPALRKAMNLYKNKSAIEARAAVVALASVDDDRVGAVKFAPVPKAEGTVLDASGKPDADAEGPPDIDLSELLDEMTGMTLVDPSAGTTADSGAGKAGEDETPHDISGAYVDPEDLKEIAELLKRAKRAAAVAAAGSDDEEEVIKPSKLGGGKEKQRKGKHLSHVKETDETEDL